MGRHERPYSPLAAMLTVRFGQDGTAEIRVDGQHYATRPITWGELDGLYASIATERRCDLSIVVTDAAGRQTSDFYSTLTPGSLRTAAPVSPWAPLDQQPPGVRERFVEITAEGFIEGEDVEVALIVRSGSADRDGAARTIIDRQELPAGARGVVLYGAQSGTIHVEYGL